MKAAKMNSFFLPDNGNTVDCRRVVQDDPESVLHSSRARHVWARHGVKLWMIRKAFK